MKNLFVIVFILIAWDHLQLINGQGMQQLSYANAEIGGKLIRTTAPPHPTTSTEDYTATTKKPGFFSGIRNIFSRKTTTEAPPIPTTAVLLSTKRPISAADQISSSTGKPSTTTATTTTTTTTPKSPIAVVPGIRNVPSSTVVPRTTDATYKPPTPSRVPSREDFPELKPPKTPPVQPTVGPIHFPSSTTHNVWSTVSTTTLRTAPTPPNRVNFVPRPLTTAVPLVVPSSSTTPSGSSTTNSELEELTEILFNKESSHNVFNRLTVNYQGKTQSSATTDEAPLPLIDVDDSVLKSVNTISKMRALYDNYEKDTKVNEFVTPLERREETELIDVIMVTPIIRQTMTFLQQKGHVTADPKTHRDLLRTIWFNTYSRGFGKIGSSAFEHVFLSELKNGTVSGLHNWVYFADQEKEGVLDYKGYLKKVELGTKGSILKYRMSYNNIVKPVNAMFIGTSPELEMALYTLCFQVKPDTECPVSLGGNKFKIRTHTFRYRGKNLIGSAFPEI